MSCKSKLFAKFAIAVLPLQLLNGLLKKATEVGCLMLFGSEFDNMLPRNERLSLPYEIILIYGRSRMISGLRLYLFCFWQRILPQKRWVFMCQTRFEECRYESKFMT